MIYYNNASKRLERDRIACEVPCCSRLASFCVRINGLNVCGGGGIDVVSGDGRQRRRLNTL